MKIDCYLNGKFTEFSVSSDTPLLQLLTEHSRITSLRPECGMGVCGNCVVLLNDQPVLSCLVPAFEIRGQQVTTLERFQKTRDFTDISKAFSQTGSTPCSYCFSSKVLLTHGIISRNVHPDPEDIIQAFSLNACTCLAPSQIVKGVTQAGAFRGRRRRYVRRK